MQRSMGWETPGCGYPGASVVHRAGDILPFADKGL